VGPRTGHNEVEKRKFLTLPGLELNPPVIPPIASRYTDYTVLAPKDLYTETKSPLEK
jgi:hypothetical protein